MKLAPGLELISVNFGPTQEIGPKVGSGHSSRVGVLLRDYSIPYSTKFSRVFNFANFANFQLFVKIFQ